MKKVLLALAVLIACNTSIAAPVSQTQKLYSLCKVWGFLKYHHPQVAQGKYNWDDELFKKLDEIKPIATKDELNSLYIKWIESLGDVPTKVLKVSKADTVFKNTDERWMLDSTLFTAEISNKLQFIFNNRYQEKNAYLDYANYGRLIFKDVEKIYPVEGMPDEKYRLLTLFRFWNIFNYYGPYKYLTDENWDAVLIGLIPRFIAADSPVAYHRTVAAMCSYINDGHGAYYGFAKRFSIIYGKYHPPFSVAFINNKAVIRMMSDTTAMSTSTIKPGDVIISVNNKPISELIKEKEQFICASNNTATLYFLGSILLWGDDSIMQIKYERNAEIFTAEISLDTIHRLSLKEIKTNIKTYNKYYKGRPDKLIGNVAYVDMRKVRFKNIAGIFRRCKPTQTMILDCRSYPRQATTMLLLMLGALSAESSSATIIDNNLPGNFIADTTAEKPYKKLKVRYKGKLILLVDENVISWGETNIMALQTIPGTVTIGCQTAGADGDVTEVPVPTGGYLSFSSLGWYYPKYRQLQRNGVTIDIPVQRTVQGVAEGKDEILERALEYIRTGK